MGGGYGEATGQKDRARERMMARKAMERITKEGSEMTRKLAEIRRLALRVTDLDSIMPTLDEAIALSSGFSLPFGEGEKQ